MAELRCTSATRSAIVDAVVARMALGPGQPCIEFRATPRPDSADDAGGGPVLGTLLCALPLAAPADAGMAEFLGIGAEVPVHTAGRITWALFRNGSGEAVFDCDVTATDGGGAIELSSVRAAPGDRVQLTSFSLSV